MEIFQTAKTEGVIFMTKDSDFVELLYRFGSPPKIIWLTCGNTSNARLREILLTNFLDTLELFQLGEELVELSGY